MTWSFTAQSSNAEEINAVINARKDLAENLRTALKLCVAQLQIIPGLDIHFGTYGHLGPGSQERISVIVEHVPARVNASKLAQDLKDAVPSSLAEDLGSGDVTGENLPDDSDELRDGSNSD